MAFALVAAIIGIVATVASTAVGVMASQQQAAQQKKIAKYNAQVAENQAFQARQAAAVRAEQSRERSRRIQSAARARAAASGVELEGSPGFVLLDNARQAELDAQRLKYGGEVQAEGYDAQARLHRFMAPQYEQAGMIQSGTTLLTGFSQASGYAMKMYSAGGSGGGAQPMPRTYEYGYM